VPKRGSRLDGQKDSHEHGDSEQSHVDRVGIAARVVTTAADPATCFRVRASVSMVKRETFAADERRVSG
jgi:hypothetical protein